MELFFGKDDCSELVAQGLHKDPVDSELHGSLTAMMVMMDADVDMGTFPLPKVSFSPQPPPEMDGGLDLGLFDDVSWTVHLYPHGRNMITLFHELVHMVIKGHEAEFIHLQRRFGASYGRVSKNGLGVT